MSKKKKVLIGLLVVLLIGGMWVKRPRTIYDIVEKDILLEEEVLPAQLCMIWNMPWGTEMDLRRAEIENREDINKIIAVLRNTEAVFSGWKTNGITYYEGTERYGLTFYLSKWYPVSDGIDFLSDGKMYYGDMVYEIRGNDSEKVTDLLEELLTAYETEK